MKTTFFTFTAIILFILCHPATAGNLKNDGRIAIYNYHANEYAEIIYREGTRYLPEAEKEIARLFRSRDGKTLKIDLRLIELIDHLQEHFGAETVELVSGYRSPAYNRSLIEAQRGAANESLHTKGHAADIHIDEVSEEVVFDYAAGLDAGGVGEYPRFGFIHLDLGAPRTWKEAASAERILTGTENNPNSNWGIVTDKNTYARGGTISATLTNNAYEKMALKKNVWLDRFRKGSWSEHTQIEKRPRSATVPRGGKIEYEWKIPDGLASGKYRLVIFTNKDISIPPVYSNEFYIRAQ